MGLVNSAIIHAIPFVPRGFIRRIAGRYIAGETRADALEKVRSNHRAGLLSTVDMLGENATSAETARKATDEYLALVEALAALRLGAEVSVKLTLLGLRLAESVASEHVEEIVKAGAKLGTPVTIDMEDSTTTDATLRIFRGLREKQGNVGVAIQAYLRRSAGDIASLLPLRPAVRVCKGIYTERPEVALTDRRAIRQSFLHLTTLLLDGGGYPAIATHDSWLVARALDLLRQRGRKPEDHEFQMLLGVGEALRPRILAAGSRLRLYCPFGADWYDYSVRRLRENPKMAGYIVRSLLRPRVVSSGGPRHA